MGPIKRGLYSKGQKGLMVTWLKLSKKMWMNQAIKELKNKTEKEKLCWILYFKEILASVFRNSHKTKARIKLPKIAPPIE